MTNLDDFFNLKDENESERLINVLERIADSLEILVDSNNKNNLKEKPKELIDLINQDNNSDFIKNYLEKKNIYIKNIPEINEEINDVLYKLASFMGNNYSKISYVYKAIKSKLSTGDSVKIFMKNFTQEEVSLSCQFCHNLHEIAFLNYYKYLKSPKFQIIASPNRIPLVINFLTGHWLECYVVNEIKNFLNKNNIDKEISFILNPQITLPNGDDFELDLLFSIGEEIYWFESKTGDYQNYVEKYSKVAKILKNDHLHPFMILTEFSQQTCDKLSFLFGMKVIYVENFPMVLDNELKLFENETFLEKEFYI